MDIRVRLSNFLKGTDAVVILKCPDDAGEARGKYIVGRHQTDPSIVALVFDAEILFHPAIAKKYHLIAFGGGHFEVDHGARSIRISGRSDTYGAEPNRQFTASALEAALPTYSTFIESSTSVPEPGAQAR